MDDLVLCLGNSSPEEDVGVFDIEKLPQLAAGEADWDIRAELEELPADGGESSAVLGMDRHNRAFIHFLERESFCTQISKCLNKKTHIIQKKKQISK